MSINRWADKENAAYMYSEILFNLEREGNLGICDEIDGPWKVYPKWKKQDTERQILYDLSISVWNPKY